MKSKTRVGTTVHSRIFPLLRTVNTSLKRKRSGMNDLSFAGASGLFDTLSWIAGTVRHSGFQPPKGGILQRRATRWEHALLLVMGGIFCTAETASYAQQPSEVQFLAKAQNPDPQKLPTLGVWVDEKLSRTKKLTMVAASFPNVPGLICDSWCYESDLDYLDAQARDGGKLKLRHRVRQQPHVILVTTVTPEPGAVEFLARAELEKEGASELPPDLLTPNLCWQLRRAQNFASAPDPYPEFIKRCFIFTEKGRTFLHETTRRKIPVRPADDRYNNPPWVQMYVGSWQESPHAGPKSWADYSPDRYTTTVIGIVSRDGKYLAALANDSATLMAQAWHDCLHNNPRWQPADSPPAQRSWRLKVYAMENEPNALLARVAKDFPKAPKPDSKRE